MCIIRTNYPEQAPINRMQNSAAKIEHKLFHIQSDNLFSDRQTFLVCPKLVRSKNHSILWTKLTTVNWRNLISLLFKTKQIRIHVRPLWWVILGKFIEASQWLWIPLSIPGHLHRTIFWSNSSVTHVRRHLSAWTCWSSRNFLRGTYT